jgi:DNA (cytosine-5)-methyltransferase 1
MAHLLACLNWWPIELERINTFPDNLTKLGDITDTKRAFFRGNAPATKVITRLGISLARAIELA